MDLILGLLPSTWPAWLNLFIAGSICGVLVFTFMGCGPLLYTYGERKIAGFMQDRLGPMRVGPYGLLQSIADTIKLLFKEAIYPAGVDRFLFVAAPLLVVTGAFLTFVVIPFGDRLITADLNIGVFYVTAVASLSTVGLIMAGWASNNKYAMLGAMRAAAQIVSYEIPALMSLLVPVLLVGSLSTRDLTLAQAGGLQNWLIFRYFPLMPIVFLVYFTATLAESNRTPFDIPEGESELVAGFHVEYSGFFFAMFFLAEYTEMFVVSAVGSVLFLGGWYSPFPGGFLDTIPGTAIPLGWFWLIAKAWTLVFVHMWLRWTLPRLRVDQLMHVAWKVLLPIAFFMLVLIGGLSIFGPTRAGFPWDKLAGVAATLGLVGYLFVTMVAAWRSRSRRIQEMAA